MTRSVGRTVGWWAAGLIVAGGGWAVWAQADKTKREVVERPVEQVVQAAAPVPSAAAADVTKRFVFERPATAVVAGSSPAAATNPAAEPGAVRWHPTFEAARAAAKASGKPVLLFHLMGQLDKQFC